MTLGLPNGKKPPGSLNAQVKAGERYDCWCGASYSAGRETQVKTCTSCGMTIHVVVTNAAPAGARPPGPGSPGSAGRVRREPESAMQVARQALRSVK